MTKDPVEWIVRLGEDVISWSWEHGLDPWLMRPVRTPRATTKSGHVRVFAYSMTTGAHVKLESGLEHDLLRDLDRRWDVVWLVAQPFRLRLPLRRKSRLLSHTPDLLSVAGDGSVTVWDVGDVARHLVRTDHRGLGLAAEKRNGVELERGRRVTGLAVVRLEPGSMILGEDGPVLITSLGRHGVHVKGAFSDADEFIAFDRISARQLTDQGAQHIHSLVCIQ